jgi:hypothetical protein
MQWISLDSSQPAKEPDKQVENPLVDPVVTRLSADALSALTAVPPIVLDNPDPKSPQDSGEDLFDRSAPYGRYLSQINARILRAWLRPRTPIGSSLFFCRARIDQDTRGNVKEVTLEACNGDARWQVSVVRAIQSSSPLPAPPDPRVFRHDVTVSLQSLGYQHGMEEDEFEPPAAQLAETGVGMGENEGISVASSRDGMELRIVGPEEPTQLPPIDLNPSRHAIGALEGSDNR